VTPNEFSIMIQGQVGAPGGLWTGTPVDWRGNEGPILRPNRPVTWPANASVAVPPDGARVPGGSLVTTPEQ